MTTNDRTDACAHKSRRRRPSVGDTGVQAPDITPVIPTPPPVDQPSNDEDSARSSVRRSRTRSSSTSRRHGVGGAKSRRISTTAIVERRRDGNNNYDEIGSQMLEVDAVGHDQGEVVARRRRSRSRTRRSSGSNGPELVVGDHRTTSRAGLPSRARHYREQSIGPTKSSIGHQDRPPSRQRHAFPTNLIDANAFCSPIDCALVLDNDTAGRDSSAAYPTQPVTNTNKNERPPSRYMTKSNRRGQSGNASTRYRPNNPESSTPIATTDAAGDDLDGISSVPPRRFAIDYGSFSCNQAHHDPKTDGFADVDESIPPPFRIEITTTESAPPLSPATATSPPASSTSLNGGSYNTRPPRRSASFGNNQSIRQPSALSSDGRQPNAHGSHKSSFNPLEWFGTDDQINEPDNFETIVTLSSSPQSDPSLDGDGEDDARDDGQEVETCVQWPETGPPRTAGIAKSGDQHWMIRSKYSSNNNTNGSLNKRTAPNYEDMDSDTAIAQTPLYEASDDLMAFATQMTDLRLDDYSLADAMATSNGNIIHSSLSNGIGANIGPAGLGCAVPPLHTSLGHDFLSLFAQH